MIRGLVLSAALSVGALAVGPATAAPMSTPSQALVGEMAEGVHYRHGGGWHNRHCRRWNHECRDRWGYGWRYQRCMRRHGC